MEFIRLALKQGALCSWSNAERRNFSSPKGWFLFLLPWRGNFILFFRLIYDFMTHTLLCCYVEAKLDCIEFFLISGVYVYEIFTKGGKHVHVVRIYHSGRKQSRYRKFPPFLIYSNSPLEKFNISSSNGSLRCAKTFSNPLLLSWVTDMSLLDCISFTNWLPWITESYQISICIASRIRVISSRLFLQFARTQIFGITNMNSNILFLQILSFSFGICFLTIEGMEKFRCKLKAR